MESRYKEYVDSLTEELTQREAWKIFHRLIFRAENVREEIGFCNDPINELMKFQFSKGEMEELKIQADRYLEYWRKYSLKDFV